MRDEKKGKMEKNEASYWDEKLKDTQVLMETFCDSQEGRMFQYLANIILAGQILDIGCGVGPLLHAIEHFAQARKHDYHGVDFSEVALEESRMSFLELEQNLFLANATKLPFEDGSFEVVVLSRILGYGDIGVDTEILKEAWRLVKQWGMLIIVVPFGNVDDAKDCDRLYYKKDLVEMSEAFSDHVDLDVVEQDWLVMRVKKI